MLDGYPFWAVWLFFLFGALTRGQATYWLGRLANKGIEQHRKKVLFERGRDIIERLGIVAVPLAYLTIGVQSAIIFAAGVMKMSWKIFSLAQLPGAAAWATIYSTVGFAAWEALAGSWWALGVIVVLVVVGIMWWLRRRSRAPEPSEP